MQTSSPASPAAPIQVPKIDTDEPVAVIPVASVAPLDGRPDGERITTFALARQKKDSTSAGFELALRDRVLAKPLTYAMAALALGFVVGRALR